MPPSTTAKATAKASHPHNGSAADADIEGSENEWKFRAPYKIHNNKHTSKKAKSKKKDEDEDMKDGNGEEEKDSDEDGGDFKAIYEGGCHCGKVKYQLGREKPIKSKFCHCGTCQRIHGAPFQHAAIFQKEDINFLKGHHDLQWYDSTEKTTRHKLPCKVSCKHCGSWIMDEGRNMILLFPGTLELTKEEKENFRPELHMFYENRVVDINDGLPKWAGMQEKSELIADSPIEAIKKRKREVEEEEREERAKKRNGETDEGEKSKD